MSDRLSGKRILVVEDEYFIASDLQRSLTQAGATVVGPVGDLDEGLALAEKSLDAAILDVNLEKAMSYPIADRLQNRNVPYMFLTGYDGWSLPHEHRDTARLAKPFTTHSVMAMVEQIVTGTKENI